MNPSSHHPIGIFDSGIGGLTVAHAIKNILPHETLIYFGDTAHLPYGDKSEAAIQAYSIKIANVLLAKKCKVIVIACHSASSASYELLKEYVGREAHIINVIDPMIDELEEHYKNATVGVIGTKRTIQSNIYSKKIQEKKLPIQLRTLPTPLLAPMIEEGFFNNQISKEIISQYLSDAALGRLDALVLACTHYPLIKNEIEEYYQGKTTVLDSSLAAARTLHRYLSSAGLINTSQAETPHFFVSDYTESFEMATRLFFGEAVKLESYPLWH
ncbi:MAG: glutamate racemase [Bacteroidetes bacterium]|nr:glutamate racemase [Bacteroidota bacterium]